jgi:hypothetical protein
MPVPTCRATTAQEVFAGDGDGHDCRNFPIINVTLVIQMHPDLLGFIDGNALPVHV